MEKDWGLSHIMLRVKDMGKIVDWYVSKGIGGHQPIKPPPPGVKSYGEADFVTLNYNKPPAQQQTATSEEDVAKVLTFIQVGSLQIEVARSGDAEVGYVHHICHNTDDIQGDSEPLVGQGCGVPFTLIKNSLLEENHIEINEFGNVILSLRPGGKQRTEREKNRMAAADVNDWQCVSLGMMVKDLDKTIEYYEKLDVGVIQPETAFDTSAMSDLEIDGADTAVKARSRKIRMGNVDYEFVQPIEGEAIYKESLDKRGEGLGIMSFTVADLAKETAQLAEKDMSPILKGNPQNGGATAFFNTGKDAGELVIQLTQAG